MKNTIKPLKLTVKSPFMCRNKAYSRFKASVMASGVRMALNLGYVVIIVGRSGSGKSFIMERATPGKVIDKVNEVLNYNSKPKLTIDDIPKGSFSVNEPQIFDANTLTSTLSSLTNRAYLMAFQSKDIAQRIGLDQIFATRRRIEINFTI